jgi:putative membrane protein
MKQPDWTKPQRQPIAGLWIVFLNTLWEVFKRVWPFLILMLLGENKEGKANRYEIITAALLLFTIIGAVLQFIYFRFYIEDAKLVIKRGWLKKETKIIPLEKIQTVHIEQGPIHQLLNVVKLSIDTAGSKKAEAEIKALHKSMAEALKAQLVTEKSINEREGETVGESKNTLFLQLNDKDLFKLSLSANHLETFFLFLSFGFGLYENFKGIDESIFSGMQDFLPRQAAYAILFFAIAILLITIIISTARIFLKFYHFRIFRTIKGLQIKSGLLNVKERVISFQKIQFVSWKASWMRKLFGLWMLEYHIAGGDEIKQNQKVQLPITQDAYIPLLVNDYFELPIINAQATIRMHASFVWRKLLMAGVLPSVFIIPLLWLWLQEYSIFFLAYPLLVFIFSWCVQKKFRLWALENVLYLRKGVFGEERILMQWHKMQSIEIRQSIYQRRKELANLVIQTAGGNITIHFISLPAARELVNYTLYKTEFSAKAWL